VRVEIIAVEAYPIRLRRPRPYSYSRGVIEWFEQTWVRVVTDDGVDGFGTIDRAAIGVDLVERRFRPLLLGLDPLQKELAWDLVWSLDRSEELPLYALGAVDTALWDITAKAAGLPLYKLLGGYRDSVPAYASTGTFRSIEEYLDVADQCVGYGFKAIKLHAWGDHRRDAELCQRLRTHVGDAIELMYDGSAEFDPYQALYLGRALEEAGYLWYEEPMREFGTTAYRRLCDALEIPILAPETADGVHYTAAQFIVDGAADMVRTGVHYRGVTGAMRVAHLADAFHLNAEVHGDGPANLHVALAIKNSAYYECFVVSNPIDVEPGVGSDGHIRPSPLPGIGYDITVEDLRNGRAPIPHYTGPLEPETAHAKPSV
jgi:L-alanine-DL-glutamate epimerase-like enolase superfamily enzyme